MFYFSVESNTVLYFPLSKPWNLLLSNMMSDSPYLSHLERFLMLHTSLETKAPWCSTRQYNYHFLCDHFSALSVFFFFFLVIFCSLIFVFHLGGPQCIGPMVSNQGPLRELWPALCLPHCPGADVSLSPASRLTLEHTCTCTHTC